uniref:Uncharacterized protein n=1 Tax=Rhizophora mucronata TaxID=61149 RepID=A0A2P2MY07_RHIMU
MILEIKRNPDGFQSEFQEKTSWTSLYLNCMQMN